MLYNVPESNINNNCIFNQKGSQSGLQTKSNNFIIIIKNGASRKVFVICPPVPREAHGRMNGLEKECLGGRNVL